MHPIRNKLSVPKRHDTGIHWSENSPIPIFHRMPYIIPFCRRRKTIILFRWRISELEASTPYWTDWTSWTECQWAGRAKCVNSRQQHVIHLSRKELRLFVLTTCNQSFYSDTWLYFKCLNKKWWKSRVVRILLLGGWVFGSTNSTTTKYK